MAQINMKSEVLLNACNKALDFFNESYDTALKTYLEDLQNMNFVMRFLTKSLYGKSHLEEIKPNRQILYVFTYLRDMAEISPYVVINDEEFDKIKDWL